MKKKTPKTKVSNVITEDPKYRPITLEFSEDDSFDGQGGVSRPFSKKEFAQYICDRIEAGVYGRISAGFDDFVRRWRDQYENVVPPKNFPWRGSSNISVPLSRSICDTQHAFACIAIFGISPIYKGSADTTEKRTQVFSKEQAMEFILRNVVNLPAVGDEAILDAMIDSTAILMPYWKRTVGKTRQWAINEMGQYSLVEKEEIIFDGPCVDRVDILDFGMYPVLSKCIEEAQVSFVRKWLNATELRQGVIDGCFDAEAVERVVSGSPQGNIRYAENAGGDRNRNERIGLKPNTEITSKDEYYETFITLIKKDIDLDGIPELCLVHVELGTKEILRAEIFPYFHDTPFFVPIVAFKRKGSFYGYSLMEILQDPQLELNAIHNQRVDNGTLRNTAVFKAKRSLQWEPDRSPIRPGQVIWCDNPEEDIVPMQFGAENQDAFASEDASRAIMKEVGGVNDLMLAQTQNGNSTLGESERALQSAGVKNDVMINRLKQGFDILGQQFADLLKQFAPEKLEIPSGIDPRTNMPMMKSITREDFISDGDFRVHGTSALANPVLQAQLAEKLYLWAERDPFAQSDPAHMYMVTRRYLEGNGEQDPEQYIGTLEEFLQKQQQQEPDKPERKISVSEKRDEALTLALAIKNGELTPDEYMQAARLANAATLAPGGQNSIHANPLPPAPAMPMDNAPKGIEN